MLKYKKIQYVEKSFNLKNTMPKRKSHKTQLPNKFVDISKVKLQRFFKLSKDYSSVKGYE